MSPSIRVAAPPEKPLLIYDGDCDFCRYWIERWRWFTGERVKYRASQEAEIAGRFPEISPERFDQSVQLIQPDGRVLDGAAAIIAALGARWPWIEGCFKRLPLIRPAAESMYRFVAVRRGAFSKLNRWLVGPQAERPRHARTFWLFQRGLGLVYLIAFASLWSQILPLSGERGIEPAREFMDAIRRQSAAAGLGWERFLRMPTLCWFSASDSFLTGLCAAGAGLSLLVIAGVLTAPNLALLWLIYLSLATVCRTWLGFQWDNLLLETGLIAVFLAPWRWWENPRAPVEPPLIPILILRWLLFRLMFMSGCVKLLSGDAAWADWTALTHHYETQPLPNPLAWHVHQWPAWFHRAATGIMFGIELIVPFLIFLPRRIRLFSLGPQAALMLLILLTGNYTFFNWLALLLCFALFDDHALRHFLPPRWRGRVAGATVTVADEAPGWRAGCRWIRLGLAVMFLLLVNTVTSDQLLRLFRQEPPRWMTAVHAACQPLRSINSYGLFAVMTTTRPEIVIEGSADGRNWVAYEFVYKPGDLARRPPWVAPHQPRLDWQMWFAALGNWRQNPWVAGLCLRLLEGEPRVSALFAVNPFPDSPPRFVRAILYEYQFTTREERHDSGNWWKRRPLGEYLPAIGLRDSQ